MAGLAMRATARRWRGLGVGVRLGCGGFGRWAGGLRQQEKVPQVAQRLAARGMPSAVIADLVEAGRQDVLEEAPDELGAGEGFLRLGVGGAGLVAIGQGRLGDSLAKASRKRAGAGVASAVLGKRKVLPAGCQVVPSSDNPPPVTRQGTCGWKMSRCVQ